ncbi:MAG: 50S ribosomal protein L30 [Thaumarchaeota archaeon]|nr:50S ribosomal protein L30 [Nitrososphaerota archaeon]MCL7386841.1 50S ribosomal protein L30 [Candidatus Wolframiiraptor allenii]MCL7394124.1 50S ribosomal protein L30 [Candidatus Wolframiiraptor allenii]
MSEEAKCYLVIRIKGSVKARKDHLDTLRMLNLSRANWATIIPKTPSYEGMLKKVEHMVTWGEPNLKTIKTFLRKVEIMGDGTLDDEYVRKLGFESLEDLARRIYNAEVTLSSLREKGVKPYARLHPPRGGFKKTIKKHFSAGGEYGYRGEKINELFIKMAGI